MGDMTRNTGRGTARRATTVKNGDYSRGLINQTPTDFFVGALNLTPQRNAGDKKTWAICEIIIVTLQTLK